MIGSVEELRRYLNTTGGGGAADDALLADLLAAADDRVRWLAADRTLEPLPALEPVVPATDPPTFADTADPVTLTFPLTGRMIRVPDLRDVVEIAVDGTAYTGTYTLRGRHGQPAWWLRLPYAYPRAVVLAPDVTAAGAYVTDDRTIAITGRWGPPDGPEPRVREAVLTWAARVYHERAARWSDARQDPEGGVSSYFRAVPPAIKATIDSLRVPGV